MNDKDVESVRALAGHVASVVGREKTASALKKYQVAHRKSADLRGWLQREAIAWTLAPPDATGPMVTADQFRLLFDRDGQGWDYQQLLMIAVLEELHRRDWRPEDGAAAAKETRETPVHANDEEDDGGSGR